MLKTQSRWMQSAASALLLGATLVSGCAGSNNNAASNTSTNQTAATNTATVGGSTSEVKTLRIGYLPNIVMPQPLLGLEGEYAKRVPGVSFTGQDFPAGPAVLEALRAGTVDIAYTGPYPPIKAYAKSKDVVLLAGCATGGTELMVSKNSPYKTVKDLKGKAIGINQLGSTVDAMVRHNLIKAGLNPQTDVRLIAVPPADQAAQLLGGQIAAVAAPAPWPSQVAAKGNGRPLLNWKNILDDGNYLAGVVFTTRKFRRRKPAGHQAICGRTSRYYRRGQQRSY
jgi:ABC-type nitrate/sulfonate/bicarbonate transport system substrate-binding protein